MNIVERYNTLGLPFAGHIEFEDGMRVEWTHLTAGTSSYQLDYKPLQIFRAEFQQGYGAVVCMSFDHTAGKILFNPPLPIPGNLIVNYATRH